MDGVGSQDRLTQMQASLVALQDKFLSSTFTENQRFASVGLEITLPKHAQLLFTLPPPPPFPPFQHIFIYQLR